MSGGRPAVAEHALRLIGRRLEAESHDGRSRPQRTRRPRREKPAIEPPAGMSKRDRAVQPVAEQGERGLTYIELCALTDWRGGQATGILSGLEKRGRVRRLPRFPPRMCRLCPDRSLTTGQDIPW